MKKHTQHLVALVAAWAIPTGGSMTVMLIIGLIAEQMTQGSIFMNPGVDGLVVQGVMSVIGILLALYAMKEKEFKTLGLIALVINIITFVQLLPTAYFMYLMMSAMPPEASQIMEAVQ